jgi:hypothetical protein
MTSPAGPPLLPVQTAIYGMFKAQAICVAAKLGVADALATGPLTADELATRCGAHAPSLRRLMRYLVGEGFFERQPDGRFGLNEAADPLRQDAPASLQPMALYFGLPAVWAGWAQLHAAMQRGGSGFAAAHGEELFSYLATHPEDADVFNRFMTALVARRPPLHAHDFSAAALVVDVAGGEGATIAGVLTAYPQMRGILFDLPDVVAGGRKTLAAAGLESRCDVVGGSFFDAVPSGGDVYILSNILHDWNDADALRILKVCRAAMQTGSQLLVAEAIVAEDDEPSLAKTLDMAMLAVLGGAQRTMAEFQALFDETGFGEARIVAPQLLLTVAV